MFASIHRRLEVISRVAVWIGGGSLLLAAVMVTVDVLCRRFLGITMSGSDEYSGYIFAASTTWLTLIACCIVPTCGLMRFTTCCRDRLQASWMSLAFRCCSTTSQS